MGVKTVSPLWGQATVVAMDSFFGMEFPVPPMPMSEHVDEADERNEFDYNVEVCAE